MPKKDELIQMEKLLEKVLDKKFKIQTKDIKGIVRDEIESEIKGFKGEFALLRLRLEGSIREVRDKVKDVDISNAKIHKEIKLIKEDITNLHLKTEAYNNKLDTKLDDSNAQVADVFQRMLDTVDEINDKIERRVTNLEKHTGLVG